MITAVDTNVLLDVFTDDPTFRDRSLSALRRCLAEGRVIACDIVWSETVAAFPDEHAASVALGSIPVGYVPIDVGAAARAGAAWRDYHSRGGPRDRIVADFLVGAHALVHADRLLTRDRGFQRAAFEGLTIVDPTAS